MPYIKVSEVGRVYAMEDGDKVTRGGSVLRPNGVTVAGPSADPQRVAQWEKDGLIEKDDEPTKARSSKKKTKKGRRNDG